MEDEDPQRWGTRYEGNKLTGKKEEIEMKRRSMRVQLLQRLC
jgi:hypothetical protein